MRSYFVRCSAFLALSTVALLAISAPAQAQCPGGSCSMPSRFSFQPSFSQAFVPPAAPQLYELADSAGQAYRHTDPAYLQSWIAQRNTGLVAQARLAAAKAPPPAACLTVHASTPAPPPPTPPAFQFGLKAPTSTAACPCAKSTGSCSCVASTGK